MNSRAAATLASSTIAAGPLLVGLMLASTLVGACGQRRLMVTSDPPGAIVTANDVELGRTPLEADFVFYGVYDVQVRAPGRETFSGPLRARAPIYDVPPLDVLSLPLPITTLRAWHVDLRPATGDADAAGRAALIDRARDARGALGPEQSQP